MDKDLNKHLRVIGPWLRKCKNSIGDSLNIMKCRVLGFRVLMTLPKSIRWYSSWINKEKKDIGRVLDIDMYVHILAKWLQRMYFNKPFDMIFVSLWNLRIITIMYVQFWKMIHVFFGYGNALFEIIRGAQHFVKVIAYFGQDLYLIKH